jgi:hypothetical protein
VIVSTLTIPPLLQQVGISLPLQPLVLAALHESLLLLVIYGVTFFLSTLARAPLGIAFAMLFFTIFQFAIYLVERLTHYSLFRLGDVERFLDIQTSGSLDWRVVLPLAGVCALTYSRFADRLRAAHSLERASHDLARATRARPTRGGPCVGSARLCGEGPDLAEALARLGLAPASCSALPRQVSALRARPVRALEVLERLQRSLGIALGDAARASAICTLP